MGNRGKPSAGCRTCKSRRIKCDEGKPACARCQKSNRSCEGYGNDTHVKFKSQNDTAKRHALQDQEKRLKKISRTVLPKAFVIDLDEAVMNRFSQMGLHSEEVTGHGSLLEVRNSLYASASSSSPCVPAILAIAWAVSASFCTASQRMIVVRRKYGEAIAKLQECLSHPRLASTDDTLFAVLVMGWIERLTGTVHAMPEPNKHIDGAIMLINLRGRQNLASETARTLFSYVKVSLTVDPIRIIKGGNLSFSEEVIEADASTYNTSDAKTPFARLARTAFAISVLRDQFDRMEERGDPDLSTLREILQRCRSLDQELVLWRASIPREWEKVIYLDHHESTEDHPGSACAYTWLGRSASYPNLPTARMLNEYRMHRIAVQSVIVRGAGRIFRYQTEMGWSNDIAQAWSLEARRIAECAVDEICASVPFHLEELADTHRRKGRGFNMLQPLVVACLVPSVPAVQKRWILNRAMEIARRVGMDEKTIEKRLGSRIVD